MDKKQILKTFNKHASEKLEITIDEIAKANQLNSNGLKAELNGALNTILELNNKEPYLQLTHDEIEKGIYGDINNIYNGLTREHNQSGVLASLKKIKEKYQI